VERRGDRRFVVAFVGTLAMWWVYLRLRRGAGASSDRASRRTRRQGRIAYTYLHLPIVAASSSVRSPTSSCSRIPDHAEPEPPAAILGGPALYLVGTSLFKVGDAARRLPPFSHLVGLGCLLALAPLAVGHCVSALALSALATGALIVVAALGARGAARA
jgi:low temperature requirement protein LtrA